MNDVNDIDRLTDIAKECIAMQMYARQDDNFAPVDNRLKEILMTLSGQNILEVALYLRSTAVSRQHLPTWQMLLVRAVEVAKMQGYDTDDMFYGLLSYK